MQYFIEYCLENQQVMGYLPQEKELMSLPRDFFITVIHSIVGKPFRDWVDSRINLRNQQIKIEGNKIINVDP